MTTRETDAVKARRGFLKATGVGVLGITGTVKVAEKRMEDIAHELGVPVPDAARFPKEKITIMNRRGRTQTRECELVNAVGLAGAASLAASHMPNDSLPSSEAITRREFATTAAGLAAIAFVAPRYGKHMGETRLAEALAAQGEKPRHKRRNDDEVPEARDSHTTREALRESAVSQIPTR